MTISRRTFMSGLAALLPVVWQGHIYGRLLKQALGQAVRWQLISRNPADAVETPRVIRKDLTVLDAEQTITLLDALRDTPFYMPMLISVLPCAAGNARRGRRTCGQCPPGCAKYRLPNHLIGHLGGQLGGHPLNGGD